MAPKQTAEQALPETLPTDGEPQGDQVAPGAPSDIENADDAFLRASEGGANRTEALRAAKATKKAGKPKAAAKPKPAEGGEGHAGSVEAGEGEGEGEAAEGGDEPKSSPIYEKALNALRRGLPKGMAESIDSMNREEVLEMGLEMAESQAEQDRVGNELEQLRGKAKDGDDTGGDEEGGEGAAQPSTSKTLDFSKVLEPLDPDVYGEELPKTLTTLGNSIAESVRSELTAVFTEQVAQLQAGFQEYVVDQVKSQHLGRYPMLGDEKVWSRVEKAMVELEPGMKYDRTDLATARATKLLNRAIVSELGEDVVNAAGDSTRKAKHQKRSRSQPQPSGGKESEGTKLTGDEADDVYLRTREQTGSHREAQKAAGFGF